MHINNEMGEFLWDCRKELWLGGCGYEIFQTKFFFSLIDEKGRFLTEKYSVFKNKTVLVATEEKVMTPYVSTESAGLIPITRPNFVFIITKEVQFGSDHGFYILTSSGKLLTTSIDEPELHFIEDDCTNLLEYEEAEENKHCRLALWQLEKDGR